MDILFSLYGLIYVAYGVFFLAMPDSFGATSADPFPEFIGWMMFAIGAAFIIGFGVFATLKILAGFWIKRRTHHTACLVIAGLSCLRFPFGTVVGVFTFIVLARPSVSALFTSREKAAEPTLVDAPAVSGDES